MAERVLGVFAKQPHPGRVKTRLCPPCSPDQAARLYRVLLTETLLRLAAGPWRLVLCYAGDPDFFRRAFPWLELRPQGEGDLGQRMEQTLGALLAEGASAAALVGSDSPDLPLALLVEAFAALRQAACVTAPCRDGGYVLVGESRHTPALFRDIPWSTPTVLAATRAKARSLGIDYREVSGWEDVDDLEGLQRLLVRSPDSASARFVRTRLRTALAPVG